MLQARRLGRLVVIWTARLMALTRRRGVPAKPNNAAGLTGLKPGGRGTRVESQ